MNFQIGDIVVHRAYGPGEIVELDEKTLSGKAQLYYVVKVKDMTLWVPAHDNGQSSLRSPTPAQDYDRLFAILKSTGEPLSTDRLERKTQLQEKMRSGNLEDICYVIRDLSSVNRIKKLNENEAALFERAQSLLLNEWCISLSTQMPDATHQLKEMLEHS